MITLDITATDSILVSIKKLLGLAEDYTAFDTDILIHINTYLGVLNQLGAGVEGFTITGSSETWADFFGDDTKNPYEAATYVYLRVRSVFDPPTSGTLAQAIKSEADELGCRIHVKSDIEKL